jgi:hypothetical protein
VVVFGTVVVVDVVHMQRWPVVVVTATEVEVEHRQPEPVVVVTYSWWTSPRSRQSGCALAPVTPNPASTMARTPASMR